MDVVGYAEQRLTANKISILFDDFPKESVSQRRSLLKEFETHLAILRAAEQSLLHSSWPLYYLPAISGQRCLEV
jgi:hypothetical protein